MSSSSTMPITERVDERAADETPRHAGLAASAERIARAIMRGETFVALIGEPASTGRALTALIASFGSGPVDFICIADPGTGIGSIRRVIDQLAPPDREEPGAPAPRTVLVIQQAERLRGEVLEFLTLSTVTAETGTPVLQFLFVGEPAFLAGLDGPAIHTLRAQIATRVDVTETPPSETETRLPVPALRVDGAAWRRSRARSANRAAARVQNGILVLLATAAALAIVAIIEERRDAQPAIPTASLGSSAKPVPPGASAAAAASDTPKPAALPAETSPARAPPAAEAQVSAPGPKAGPAEPAVPPPAELQLPGGPSAAAATAAQPFDPLQRDFNEFLANWGGAAARLTQVQRGALYHQFLDWRRNQSDLAATSPVDSAAKPLGRRIVIHYRVASAEGEGQATQIAASLDPETGSTETRAVPDVPRAPTIRYFFTEDRAAARNLAATLAGITGTGWRVRSFASYRVKPPPGTIEIWLPD